MQQQQPTNLQMYSRIGKSSDEKFIMIKHQMDIISGKSKKFIPTSPLSSMKDKSNRRSESLKGFEEVIQELDKSTQNRTSTHRPKKKPSSAFKSQSRDAWYKSTTHRETVPPCGYYTVSYSLLEKNKLIPDLSKFKAHEFKVKTASEVHDPVDKPIPKTPDPIKFSLQIGRKHKASIPQYEEDLSSHTPEKSQSASSLRKIRTPDLSKTLGRTSGLFDKVCSTPSYSPRFDYVTKDFSKTHVNFSKQSPRPTMMLMNMHDLVPRKVDFKHIEKRVSVPDLGKIQSRPSSKHLPSFMLKNSSRSGLNLISDKTLEMNNFAKAEFMTVVSSFNPSLTSPKIQRKKSYTLNDSRKPTSRQI